MLQSNVSIQYIAKLVNNNSVYVVCLKKKGKKIKPYQYTKPIGIFI